MNAIKAKVRRVQQRLLESQGVAVHATVTAQEQHDRSNSFTEQSWRSTRETERLRLEQAKSQRRQQGLLEELRVTQMELQQHAAAALAVRGHEALLAQVQEAVRRLADERDEILELQARLESLEVLMKRCPVDQTAPRAVRANACGEPPRCFPPTARSAASSSPRSSAAFPSSSSAASATLGATSVAMRAALGCGRPLPPAGLLVGDEDEHAASMWPPPSESEWASSRRSSAIGAASGMASATTVASNTRLAAHTGFEPAGADGLSISSVDVATGSPLTPLFLGHSSSSPQTAKPLSASASARPAAPLSCSLVARLVEENQKLEAQVRREQERTEGLARRLETLRARSRQLDAGLRGQKALSDERQTHLRTELERRAQDTRSLFTLAALRPANSPSVGAAVASAASRSGEGCTGGCGWARADSRKLHCTGSSKHLVVSSECASTKGCINPILS